MRQVVEAANALGCFDAVIHNAGVGYREPRVETADGLEHVFAINVLAPYLLTALITTPRRLVYLSSGMHRQGDATLDDPQWARRPWNGAQAYADSKLFDVTLAFAVARRWPATASNSLEPGWVPTKMGGSAAPDDLSLAPLTQAWLAASDDPAARATGGYFYHQRPREVHPAARDSAFQERLLDYCETLTGIALPSPSATIGQNLYGPSTPMRSVVTLRGQGLNSGLQSSRPAMAFSNFTITESPVSDSVPHMSILV
jgi:NAD(P)-dependent dehydrogenase (short-subunit alcohol dehydrogenase family)